ncbi:CheR family methyltransferase [Sphingobacterium bambusae]|uniref:CheR family methyltransferase n=1 Tax=Sphingobacterium bambusae TaxID=662858 RepID=A0ABW6BDL4_9SPHI|nr:CheR family methyltransferase [Sphingobacterium bambusae]WPL48841.1 CheR family methyltransferase [Sphingobacterium bambusae]
MTKDMASFLSKDKQFPVVGVGASAGGLEAFKAMLKGIPENSGIAFILVQHLLPGTNSLLPELLQKVTTIPVVSITEHLPIEPNHVYVIPPNKVVTVADGYLKLNLRSVKEKSNRAVDVLFNSLAVAYDASSAAVILSGSGEDGTQGLMSIRERGGLTIAQDSTAEFPAMPNHAVDANIIDFVLPPEQIGIKLSTFFGLTRPDWSLDMEERAGDEEDTYRKILLQVQQHMGADFSLYKQTTIRRRIVRRMLMLKLDDIQAYQKYLEENPAEEESLFYDLLIPVTSFFRDQSAFNALKTKILPDLLQSKKAEDPIRIWVAGCSTGQEPYSIAIALEELFGERLSQQRVQIFATDISEKSIKKARSGSYLKKELTGLTALQLSRYFDKSNDQFVVKKRIRDLCVFAAHSFLKDPPFARMDLISCRNVMIYFKPFLQKKALATFHYALRDKGLLWLGKSESAGTASEFFHSLDKKNKFYTRKSVNRRYITVMGERKESAYKANNDMLRTKDIRIEDYQKSADELMLAKFMPVSVIVNEQFDIVQFRGSSATFLEPPSGKATFNIIKMAKEGLAFELRNALHRAKSAREPYLKEGISFKGGESLVSIEVLPLLNTIDLYYLVVFKEMAMAPPRKRLSSKLKRSAEEERILQLEEELAQVREDMRAISEDQELTNEELQSSNEELVSGSEELQSLNEELETSKEELQSTNEELLTVNQELFDSNEELTSSRKLAEATIAVLHEPLLMLDKDLIIQLANQAFCQTFKIKEATAIGTSIYQLQDGAWNIPGLTKEFTKIQSRDETMVEKEIAFTFPSIGERVIKFNIQPVSKPNGEQLILLALDDITARKADIHEQKVFAEELQKQINEKIKLERQKNDFISMASHELKTPVTSIKGYTQALQRRFSKEGNIDAEGFLRKMDNQINKLTALIGDLLDATKVTAGQLQYNIEDFDFNELILEITEEMQQTSRKHKIKLSLDNNVLVSGDRNRIGQVVTNLLSNAIKYSPSASEVLIDTSVSDNQVTVKVKDHGIGISKKHQENVFDQFFRASSVSDKNFAGLGLGLFIANEIIKRHRGKITVSSEEDVGSVFSIVLPIERLLED